MFSDQAETAPVPRLVFQRCLPIEGLPTEDVRAVAALRLIKPVARAAPKPEKKSPKNQVRFWWSPEESEVVPDIEVEKLWRKPRSLFPGEGLTRAELKAKGESDSIHAAWDQHRPKFRRDCAGVPRPCPWAGCKFHNFLSVNEHGSIKLHFGVDDPSLMPAEWSCSLDIADRIANEMRTGGGPLPVEDLVWISRVGDARLRQIFRHVKRELRPLEKELNGDDD